MLVLNNVRIFQVLHNFNLRKCTETDIFKNKWLSRCDRLAESWLSSEMVFAYKQMPINDTIYLCGCEWKTMEE